MKHFFSQYIAAFPRAFSAFGFLLFSLMVSPSSLAATFSPEEVVSLTNRDRSLAGIPELSWSETLSVAAEAKADDMARKGYFAHTSPEGTRPWFFFDQAGYQYQSAGENLAIHFSDAESEQRAWMASVKHRENILSPKYAEIGVAVRDVVLEGKSTVLTVQLFGTRLGERLPTVPVSPISHVAVREETRVDSLDSTVSRNDLVEPMVSGSASDRTFSDVLLFFGVLEMVALGIVLRITLRRALFRWNLSMYRFTS